jgi:hypothetical protein
MDLRRHSFSTNTPDEFTIDIVNAMNRQLRPPSAVNRQIFHRIHGAFARAERRLMTTPDERPQNITPMPISGDPSSSMHGLLPQTKAPIEFKCSICLESIKKGDDQQILNCGHKFCAGCINQWLRTNTGNASCPTCRTPVYNSSMNQAPNTSSAHPSSRFRGNNRMTPQQEAMAILMRNLNTSRRY